MPRPMSPAPVRRRRRSSSRGASAAPPAASFAAREFNGSRLTRTFGADTGDTGGDAGCSDGGSMGAEAARRLQDMLATTFLPEGFPASVTPDYLGAAGARGAASLHACMHACGSMQLHACSSMQLHARGSMRLHALMQFMRLHACGPMQLHACMHALPCDCMYAVPAIA
eukprot:125204-Chlamydomonas_euryale.AAC.2